MVPGMTCVIYGRVVSGLKYVTYGSELRSVGCLESSLVRAARRARSRRQKSKLHT